MLRPDCIKAARCGLTSPQPTTDKFHTYRIVVQNKDLKVYVDGQLRLDGPGRFTREAGGRTRVAFGGANSFQLGEALWKSVKVFTEAVSLRDAVLSIRYH
jgi:hypothetical protein